MAFLFHFCCMIFLCFNGELLPANQPIITAQNRAFRYGDGLFETIKIFESKIILAEYHFDRLFFGLKLLGIKTTQIVKEDISNQIIDLCRKNNCLQSARVRLAVYRDETTNEGSYVIEANPLQLPNALNQVGWSIELYPFARKSMDAFANLKTANYLPYILADKYAKEKNKDECIVLNTENNLSDASKANIFLIKRGEIYTPALHQGCVNGVVRRFLIEEFRRMNITLYQKEINEQMLFDADEVFLTNSINHMRWIGSFREKQYKKDVVFELYNHVFSTFYR